MNRFLSIIGVLGLLMGIAAFGYGTFAIFDQHARLNRCQTVEAQVIDSHVETIHLQHVSEHKPVVRFKYRVNGALFDCDHATPGVESGRQRWAERIVSAYPQGAKVTAYYDPQDPAYAFLVRRYDAMPYTAYLFGPLMVLCGILALRESRKTSVEPPEPVDAGDGWYQLAPPTTLRRAKRLFLGLGVGWQIAGAPAWLHYLSGREPPTPLLFVIYLPIYLAVGFLLLGFGAYAALVLSKLDDAVVLVSRPKPRTGEALAVRVEQPVRKAVVVKALEASLICRRAQRMWIHGAPQEHSEREFGVTQSALEGHPAEAGEFLVADFQLFVPIAIPPSTPPGVRAKVRYLWDLQVKTRLCGWLPYPDKFPITVEQGSPRDMDGQELEPELVDAEAVDGR